MHTLITGTCSTVVWQTCLLDAFETFYTVSSLHRIQPSFGDRSTLASLYRLVNGLPMAYPWPTIIIHSFHSLKKFSYCYLAFHHVLNNNVNISCSYCLTIFYRAVCVLNFHQIEQIYKHFHSQTALVPAVRTNFKFFKLKKRV